jgi:hypothetical protein
MSVLVPHARSDSVMSPVRSYIVLNTVAALIVSAVGATVVAGLAMAMVLMSMSHPDWQAYRFGSAIAALVAVISTIPVVACVNRPLMVAVVGYFVSAALRVVGVMAGIVAAVYIGHVPGRPVVVITLVYYAALLVVEALVLGLALWNRSA